MKTFKMQYVVCLLMIYAHSSKYSWLWYIFGAKHEFKVNYYRSDEVIEIVMAMMEEMKSCKSTKFDNDGYIGFVDS